MMAGSAAQKKVTAPDTNAPVSEPEQPGREQRLIDEIRPIDVAFVKRQMEAVYGTRLSDRDPAVRNIQVIDIAVQQAFRNANEVVAGHLDRKIADAIRSLDESAIRCQAETRADVLRFAEQLRQVFKRDETAAIKELATCARDIQAAAESMKATRIRRQWLHIVSLTVIGLCFAAGMVLCGYVLAQIR